ncbi:hypothetical protein [Micromonospora sp. CA-246542]|uniref:hypothetical protein n=1 Tax=Micromonospora sp. CA-246542 TaxID=3239959 RepID=UPI003D92D1E6
MRRHHCLIRPSTLAAILALALIAALVPVSGAARTTAPATAGSLTLTAAAPAGERWSADLSVVDRDDVNVRRTAAGLRLREARAGGRSPRSPHSALAEGMLLSAPAPSPGRPPGSAPRSTRTSPPARARRRRCADGGSTAGPSGGPRPPA